MLFHAYNDLAVAYFLSKESYQVSTKYIEIPGKWEGLEIIVGPNKWAIKGHRRF